jgi:HK97 family phage major capsid protein/HK97 family phage prohead protease
MTDLTDYEVKYTAGNEGEFEGLASCWDQPDIVGDVVAKGAFRRTLHEHRAAGRMPALLWSHDPAEVIGRWTSMAETDAGLLVKGKLNLLTQRGAEARALLLDGSISGLSIGFRTRSAERRGRGRVLTDVDLVEASLCSLPCAPNARVSAVRNESMSVDLSAPDDAGETAFVDLRPEVLERITALEAKAATVDQLSAQIDQVQTRLARPSARIEVREDKAKLEQKAFLTWCRKGADGLDDLERKALNTLVGSPTLGGWNLVPQTFLAELQRNLVEFSPMRQVARVQQVSGNPVLLPKRTANLSAAWVAEEAQHVTSSPSYQQQSISIFEARVSVEVTNQLLEDSAFDLSAELTKDFGAEFARLEGKAFVDGNGVSEPEGFRTSATFAVTGNTVTADTIIDLYHSIPSVYSSRGTWLLPREQMAAVRKLKTTGTGVYLWAESLQPGNPPTILGRPVVEMPDMATVVGSPTPARIAFGDWNRAYRIFDRVGLEVLRDPYSKATFSLVIFHARKRVGGALVDGAAVRGLTG